MDRTRVPADRGLLVMVVGASGAGKDSLLGVARDRLAGKDDIHFVRRCITRPPDELHEPHQSVSESEFRRRLLAGDFVTHWEAHGLYYGIPVDVVEVLRAGRLAVLNGSRAALPRFQDRFPRRRVVHVTVPDAVLQARLAGRGREDVADQNRRLSRCVDARVFDGETVWALDNSGPLERSADRFVTRLLRWRRELERQTLASCEPR